MAPYWGLFAPLYGVQGFLNSLFEVHGVVSPLLRLLPPFHGLEGCYPLLWLGGSASPVSFWECIFTINKCISTKFQLVDWIYKKFQSEKPFPPKS